MLTIKKLTPSPEKTVMSLVFKYQEYLLEQFGLALFRNDKIPVKVQPDLCKIS